VRDTVISKVKNLTLIGDRVKVSLS
jgi:hypothetical protein